MSASQILLAGHGQEDQWLTNNPDRTYFEAKYNPRVNRSRETFEVPFDNQEATFGSTGRCTIPVKGDYLTRLTLRAVMPPIYPTVPGQYVYPTPSSQVGGTVYVNMGLTFVVADGVTLTANTAGNHYFSIGAQVTLAGTAYIIFDLDNTYTITSIPTANSFTCSTTLAGISYNGTVSSPGIQCGDIISYFSTQNSNLWVNNLTNKTWQITGGTVVGTTWTLTTSAPSNFPVGSQVLLNLPLSGILNGTATVLSSTDTTFTFNNSFIILVLASYPAGGQVPVISFSYDNGETWSNPIMNPGGGVKELIFANGVVFKLIGGYLVTRSLNILNPFADESFQIQSSFTGWKDMAFGNGTFVAVGSDYGIEKIARSVDYDYGELTWNLVSYFDDLNSVAFGDGKFVAVGVDNATYSTTNGVSWSLPVSLPGIWKDVAFGNDVFVTVSFENTAYSTTNGASWVTVPLLGLDFVNTGDWVGVAYGNGVFVVVSQANLIAHSSDNGQTWSTPVLYQGNWNNIEFINGVFIAVSQDQVGRSVDGISWTFISVVSDEFNPFNGTNWSAIGYSTLSFDGSPSDSVSLVTPPLQLTDRVFSSEVYPSISFVNASDAAFWGFDARNGLSYTLPATPPWTYTQSGWISGFLPPSTSTYDDSVAHKLCKAVRVLVGKQTIKEYSGEYIELQNDLLIPYENKAILKLMNGTLDQTQAIVPREYYVNLPMGTKEIPLCALTNQHMSVEIDFESYMNLSQNLNPGTGDFLNPQSYLTYDASTGILNGQPVDVQTTFSYQQYIFIVTYGGQFIVYDTTKDVADPTSYIVLSAFSGASLFGQFCVLSGNLYIGLTDGQLARMIISELIQGNISSFVVNNYTPTIGSLTGTMVADFRYLYYTVRDEVTLNVFVIRYDTTGSFTNLSSYTTVDFTQTFNSGVIGVYQILSTGTELIMLPQGTPGSLYTYQLNANVQSQWYSLDYSMYGSEITEGLLINDTLYFICDGFNILKYVNSVFTLFTFSEYFVSGQAKISRSRDNGQTWTSVYTNNTVWNRIIFVNDALISVSAYQDIIRSTDNGDNWSVFTPLSVIAAWYDVIYANDVVVAVGNIYDGEYKSARSTDGGLTWTFVTSQPSLAITFGKGIFVITGNGQISISDDNGLSWLPPVSVTGYWQRVTFGNGIFVAVDPYNEQIARSIDGQVWEVFYVPGYWLDVTFGNGVFIAVNFYNELARSVDGIDWTDRIPYGIGFPYLYSISYSSGVFMLGGSEFTSRSTDNGSTWSSQVYYNDTVFSTVSNPSNFTIPGDGYNNFIAVGNYIYCSTGNVAVQIDTTKDLSSPEAYKFPAPLPVSQYIFANGPRYIYMFDQVDSTATNIVRFDPYPPTPILKTSILVDYESLPEGAAKPDKALIGLVQTQKVTDMNYMDIHGPVKELWVTGTSDSANVFQYSNLAPRSTLSLAGEQIVTDDDGTHTFLNVIEPFETHTSMPIRNVSVVSFEFDPESEVPNGTVNFSRIRDQVFDGNAETVWARTYNLLAIQGGTGGLMFN
jgi:hypothetical protein